MTSCYQRMMHHDIREVNLVVAFARRELTFFDEHPESEEEHDESVTEVAEHDTEEEREADEIGRAHV